MENVHRLFLCPERPLEIFFYALSVIFPICLSLSRKAVSTPRINQVGKLIFVAKLKNQEQGVQAYAGKQQTHTGVASANCTL